RTLHPAPQTLHPTPDTQHPTPYSLHPAPYTLHPAPYKLPPYPANYRPFQATGRHVRCCFLADCVLLVRPCGDAGVARLGGGANRQGFLHRPQADRRWSVSSHPITADWSRPSAYIAQSRGWNTLSWYRCLQPHM
ncbi:hypothetical protein T484DRAFT_1630885, partial [Baffinella frigidus]